MKKGNYIGLWLLLSLALAVILCISFADHVTLFGHTLKKSGFAEALTGNHADPLEEADAYADSIRLEQEKKLTVVTTDSMPQSIFIFGDSMTFNLALRLAQYARQNGHQINSVNWDSSNTKIWADHDTLAYYIEKFHPTQIFISLGSNEVYFKNPEIRKPYVEKILQVIDTIPYVWIGPPNWNEDTGINDMLARTCKPGSFFRSAGMEFKRKKDNIHPTREASALWIDSIIRWLPQSAHPFVAEIPSDSIGKCNPHITFLKALNK